MELEFINITPNTSKYMQHPFNIVWFKIIHVNFRFYYLVFLAETQLTDREITLLRRRVIYI